MKMVVSLSTRRLRLCLAAVSACILLPVLGLVLFYDKKSTSLLSREHISTGVWQQTTENVSATQWQQDMNKSTSTVWYNLSQTTKIWLQTAQISTVASSKSVLTTIPPSLGQVRTQHKKILNSPQALHFVTLPHQNAKRKKKTIPWNKNYVLALNYWDQQTSALRNLLSLQCWAGHFGHQNVFVVEPFVINSRFGALPTTDDERQHQIKFRDMFDIAQWKKSYFRHTYGKPFAHLAPWSEFTAKAPKKVILVSIGYTRFGKNCTQALASDLRVQCNSFLNKYNFQVLREVCIDVQDMTRKEFDAKILGNLYYLHSVTIIFSEWRGIKEDRISLTDSHCSNGIGFVQGALNLRTSPKVINDMKKYIQTYYGEEQVYVALVIRLEKLIINSDKGNALSSVKMCLSKVFNHWFRFKKNFGLKFTFVAMDYGKFGSVVFSMPYASEITSDIAESVENLLRSIYGKDMSLQKWEESFDNVTNVTNSGYIALMQSSIAARARCILLAGGGTFQDHTLHLYKQIPRSNQCFMQLSGSCHVTHSSIPKSKVTSANHIFET